MLTFLNIQKKLLPNLISGVFLIIPFIAIFSTAYYGNSNKSIGITLAVLMFSVLTVAYFNNNVIFKFMHSVAIKFGEISSTKFWCILLFSGLILRFAWILIAPIWTTMGDNPVNWELAMNLINNKSFIADTRFGIYQGLYPPGLPFALTPFILIFGKSGMTIFTFQSTVFIWFVSVFHAFIKRLINIQYARLGSILIALFPPLIIESAFAVKEPLLVALLTTSFYCLYISSNTSKSIRTTVLWAAAAGGNLGIAILTQPSLAVMLPGMLVLIPLFLTKRHRFLRTLAFVLTAIIIISPWSIRQSLMFDKFVPLTTGAGWSFYTANNPVSWGKFSHYETFFPDLLIIKERDLSKVAFERGLNFVKENPLSYVQYTLRRQMMMTCCPAGHGILSLKKEKYNQNIINAFTLLTNLTWLGLMIIIALGWKIALKIGRNNGMFLIILSFPVASFIVHSLTEAGFRHMEMHMCSWLTVFLIIIYSKNQENINHSSG